MPFRNTNIMTNMTLMKKNVNVSERVCNYSSITIEIYGYKQNNQLCK